MRFRGRFLNNLLKQKKIENAVDALAKNMGILFTYFSDESQSDNKVDTQKPKFYAGLEGPVFTTLDYNEFYATRHYEASLWVSTVISGDFQASWKEGVKRLKKYCKGANQRKWILPRTCPIIIRKSLNETSINLAGNSEDKITVSMLISQYFVEDVPGPTNPNVFIEEAYKRINFTGYFFKPFNYTNLPDDVKDLERVMLENEESFEREHCFISFYNTYATKLSKIKYYEVWFHGKKLEHDYRCITNFNDSDEEQEEGG